MNDRALTHTGKSSPRPEDAHLWVCAGRNVGQRYPLPSSNTTIGRAPDNDIVVEDERASQQHARLEVNQERHVLFDLNSTNGTYVNNRRVASAVLKDGDLVQVGETVLEYVGEPARASSEEATLYASSREQHLQGASLAAPLAHPPPPSPAVLAPPPGFASATPPQAQAQQEGGLDLLQVIFRIRAIVEPLIPYWPVAIAFAFAGVMAGALHFRLRPPPHRAEFAMVLNPQGASSILGNSESLTFFGNEVTTRFSSQPVVGEALERVLKERPGDGFVRVVANNLAFDRIGRRPLSNQFQGQFVSGDEDFAVEYLKTHIEVFLEREISMGLSQVQADVKFLAKAAERSSKKLQDAEVAMAKYKSENTDALPEQARSNYQLLFDLKRNESDLSQKMAAVEANLRENERQLRRTPKLKTSGYSTENPFASSIAQANADLAAAKAAGKTDLHPDVLRIKKNLVELQRLSKDKSLTAPPSSVAVNPAFQALEQQVLVDKAQLKGMREQKRKLQEDIQRQQTKLARLPQAEAGYIDVSQAYDAAREEHTTISKRLREAELQLEGARERAHTQYTITQQPLLVPEPMGKKRMKRLILGGAAGCFAGIALALLLAFRNGTLTLSTVLGREVDFSVVFGPIPPPSPKSPPGAPHQPLAPPSARALPAPRNNNDRHNRG